MNELILLIVLALAAMRVVKKMMFMVILLTIFDLSVSFQSTHPQVNSTTRLTAETSNLEKVSSEKSLIVILIIISSPSKS